MRLPQSSRILPRLAPIAILVALAAILHPATQAAAQQLQCSPASLKFGKVVIGQSETQFITLTNTGQTEATVSAIGISAAGVTTSGATLPFNLMAGQSIGLNVVFSPSTAVWSGGKITFTSNASNPSLLVNIGAAGAQSDALTAAPATLSLAAEAVGSQETLPVVLTNTRSGKVTLSGFTASGAGFTVAGPGVPLILDGGQSVTLNVTFTAQGAGESGGSIWISGPAASIPLTGTGTTTGQLSVTPAALNFGNVDIGSTAIQPLTMTATGASVTVSSATSSNAQFTISGVSFPFTIAAGKSAEMNVIFAPIKSVGSSGTLTVASNASDSQLADSLTGTGVTPQYSVSLAWDASTSSVAGYNVYRGTQPGVYSRISKKLDPNTAYTDGTVVSGTTYYYAATSVSSSGEESSYSAPLQVAVP
jgi:hypothetical protein